MLCFSIGMKLYYAHFSITCINVSHCSVLSVCIGLVIQNDDETDDVTNEWPMTSRDHVCASGYEKDDFRFVSLCVRFFPAF